MTEVPDDLDLDRQIAFVHRPGEGRRNDLGAFSMTVKAEAHTTGGALLLTCGGSLLGQSRAMAAVIARVCETRSDGASPRSKPRWPPLT